MGRNCLPVGKIDALNSISESDVVAELLEPVHDAVHEAFILVFRVKRSFLLLFSIPMGFILSSVFPMKRAKKF